MEEDSDDDENIGKVRDIDYLQNLIKKFKFEEEKVEMTRQELEQIIEIGILDETPFNKIEVIYEFDDYKGILNIVGLTK